MHFQFQAFVTELVKTGVKEGVWNNSVSAYVLMFFYLIQVCNILVLIYFFLNFSQMRLMLIVLLWSNDFAL